MKQIIFSLLIFISAATMAQTSGGVFNASKAQAFNKSATSMGAHGLDYKSQYHDTIHFVDRSFTSIAEANSFLPSVQRVRGLQVIINTGGSLSGTTGLITGGTDDVYYYKDGIADGNLVLLPGKLQTIFNNGDSITAATQNIHFATGSNFVWSLPNNFDVRYTNRVKLFANSGQAQELMGSTFIWLNGGDSVSVIGGTGLFSVVPPAALYGSVKLTGLGAPVSDSNSYYLLGTNKSTGDVKPVYWLPGVSFTGITNQDTTLKGNGSTTPLRVNDNLVEQANYFTRPFPLSNNTIFSGTSIFAGYTLDAGQAIPDVIQRELQNTAVINLAVSSCGTRTACWKIAGAAGVPLNAPMISDAAFNNSRWAFNNPNGVDSAHVFGIINAGARWMAAVQFASNIQFYRTTAGTVNPNVTLSGSSVSVLPADTLKDLASRTLAFSGASPFWRQSLTTNETYTNTNVQGAVIAIGVWADSIGGSRIQYAVDGVTIGTYDPNNRTTRIDLDVPSAFIRLGIQNDVIVIHGLTDTLHTVVLTFLDGSKFGGVDFISGLKTPQQAALNPLYVPDILHMNATGYAVTGGSSAVQDSATNSRWAALMLAFPEYWQGFAKINPNSYYNPNDPTQTNDGIHPTGKGARNYAMSIVNAINPKAIAGKSGGNLDAVLTAGNSSSQKMNLTGFGASDSKITVGSFEMQPLSVDNAFLTRNIVYNGSHLSWRSDGYGSMMHFLNGAMAFRTFGSGSAGTNADGSLATPFVISPAKHVGIGNNITFDDALTGATLQAFANGNVAIPNGGLAVNQAAAGIAMLEVTGTGYFKLDQNANTFLSIHNGTSGASAQASVTLSNDNNDLLQQGIYSTSTNPNAGLVAGIAYVRGSGSAGLALAADNASAPIKFLGPALAEVARFTPSGQLGIGTSSPDSLLQVVGSGHFTKSLRIDALPAGPGTKTVRYNPSNGQLSYGDTAIGGGGITTSQLTDSLNGRFNALESSFVKDFITTNGTPINVDTIPITAGEHIRVEAVLDASLSTGDASVGAKKSRKFFMDAGSSIHNGTLVGPEPEEYLPVASGLSTANFTITSSGSLILIQFTGEASTTILGKITYTVTRKLAPL